MEFSWAITVWGNVRGIAGQPETQRSGLTKRDLKRLQSLQNKAIRLIHNRDRYTPTKELLDEANQLSINQSIAYHIILQTFKIKLSKLPKYQYEWLFTEVQRNSRLRTDHLKRVELNYGQNSFFYQTCKFWPVLPAYFIVCVELPV